MATTVGPWLHVILTHAATIVRREAARRLYRRLHDAGGGRGRRAPLV